MFEIVIASCLLIGELFLLRFVLKERKRLIEQEKELERKLF